MKTRSVFTLALVLALSACRVNPPVVPAPPNTHEIRVQVEDARTHLGFVVTATISGETITTNEHGYGAVHQPITMAPIRIVVSREGCATHDQGYQLGGAAVITVPIALVCVQPAPVRIGRRGPVRLEGRAFADDDGVWNPLGVTYFPALWMEANDPDRLELNLAHAAQYDVDYIRILGMVGSASWVDRRIDPFAPDYWTVVDRLFTRLARHGRRAQVTVFADAQVMMPSTSDRERFLDAWVDFANARRDQIFLIEIANEALANGFETAASVRHLGDRARARSQIPIALSAPPDDSVVEWLGGWTGVGTLHYDRDISRADGPWRPVRQPWGAWGEYRERAHAKWTADAAAVRAEAARVAATEPARAAALLTQAAELDARAEWSTTVALPAVAVNNEPIGPDSSNASETDPLRIAMAYVTTFVAGNGAYVFHPGSGIRAGGEADLARGRKANLYDEDAATWAALSHWRRTLTPGLANWGRHNSQWPSMPWDGSQRAVDRGDLVRAFATVAGDRIVAVVLGVRGPHPITARQPRSLNFRHPLTGDVLFRLQLATGETGTVPADLPGYVVTTN